MKNLALFGLMGAALIGVGMFQSWNVALAIINLSLISAIMALGVNIQWGYAGLFNVGIMGFAALGGVAAVLVSTAPVGAAWSAGGAGIGLAGLLLIGTVGAIVLARRKLRGLARKLATVALVVGGYAAVRLAYDPSVAAIEAVDPARTGNLGGLGLPIVLAWAVGGLFAAGVAWFIGKISLGLRSDYFAIATLGISEI
ncbi:MAG: branched-chain amino acid ABC transporter permease, partial [Pseudomonadota bacterium]